MADFWRQVVQQVAGGSRTDVLRALIWPNALILGALVWTSTRPAPLFVIVLLCILLVSFLGLYGWAYVYFGKLDPNLLRSERFNLNKMAIEHGISGDSSLGITAPLTLKTISQATKTDEGM